MIKSRILAGCFVLCLLSSAALGQGSLMPPGAPAPAMRTLQQVEPRLPISTLGASLGAGSWYLTTNLVAAPGYTGAGLTVSADDVTLDLNGFSLIGVPGSFFGINAGTRRNVTIRNGTVRNWGSDGVYVAGGMSASLSQLRVHGNGGNGIWVDDRSIVSSCVTFSNAMAGIACDTSALVENCSSAGNGTYGIAGFNPGFEVRNSLAEHNQLDGFVGPGRFVNCTARRNLSHGFSALIEAQYYNCSALNNATNGFNGGQAAVIQDCFSNNNTNDGIRASTYGRIINNQSFNNGRGGTGAGVHVTGNGNRIEGNHVALNPVGYDVDTAGNLIIRNSAYGNTDDYGQVVAGSLLGPLLINSANVATNSNPHANYNF